MPTYYETSAELLADWRHEFLLVPTSDLYTRADSDGLHRDVVAGMATHARALGEDAVTWADLLWDAEIVADTVAHDYLDTLTYDPALLGRMVRLYVAVITAVLTSAQRAVDA